MRVLFVGDVVGRAGRNLLRNSLLELQYSHRIDFTIVNVENAAGGYGLTPAIGKEMLSLDVDVMTSGNHVWDQKGISEYLSKEPRLLRPGNYPAELAGSGIWCGESRTGVPVAVLNLQGRVFMPLTDCPFRKSEADLRSLDNRFKVVIVDFHAEATSEKMALGWFLDGKVSAVVGTHTHVPTADARILPKGSAYVTDVGMTGSYHSVIGMKAEQSLPRFLTGVGSRMEPETRHPRLSAVMIEVDDSSGKALEIHRCDHPKTFTSEQ